VTGAGGLVHDGG